MKNNNSNNIIHFSKFKTMYNENSANNCFKEYLEVLSFSELINESNSIESEIRNGNVNKELTSKTRLILNEFEKRTGEKKVSQIKKSAESKIINLEKFL